MLYNFIFNYKYKVLVGWYMVKSGLVNDVTVSHYRLSLTFNYCNNYNINNFLVTFKLKK